MSKTKTLSVVGAGLAMTLAAATAQAAPLRLLAPAQDGAVQQVQYIEGYNRHHHHHGHVHGNPYRRHLDCNSHGDHGHCQVHNPRRHYHHHGHVHGTATRTGRNLTAASMAIMSTAGCIGPTAATITGDGCAAWTATPKVDAVQVGSPKVTV